MPNSIFRKGLVIVVICLLMLMSPLITAFSIQDRTNEEFITRQNDGVADLVIESIMYNKWEDLEEFWVYAVNDGEGDVPSGPRTETLIVYYDYLLLPFVWGYSRTEFIDYYENPLLPGEKFSYWANFPHATHDEYTAILRMAFWINPSKDIIESDYENNGVWGLYFIHVERYLGTLSLIGDLYQWKTDGSSPWWYLGEDIEYNHFSQTTQQTTTQQTTSQQSNIQQTQTTQQQTIRSNFLNRLIQR